MHLSPGLFLVGGPLLSEPLSDVSEGLQGVLEEVVVRLSSHIAVKMKMASTTKEH